MSVSQQEPTGYVDRLHAAYRYAKASAPRLVAPAPEVEQFVNFTKNFALGVAACVAVTPLFISHSQESNVFDLPVVPGNTHPDQQGAAKPLADHGIIDVRKGAAVLTQPPGLAGNEKSRSLGTVMNLTPFNLAKMTLVLTIDTDPAYIGIPAQALEDSTMIDTSSDQDGYIWVTVFDTRAGRNQHANIDPYLDLQASELPKF